MIDKGSPVARDINKREEATGSGGDTKKIRKQICLLRLVIFQSLQEGGGVN